MIIPKSIIRKDGVVNWVHLIHNVSLSYLILLPVSFLILTKYEFLTFWE